MAISRINLPHVPNKGGYYPYVQCCLSHHKCTILMIFYLTLKESGARWYSPIISSWLVGSGGARIFKEHHSGAYRSNAPATMNIVSPSPSAVSLEQGFNYNKSSYCVFNNLFQVYIDHNGWLRCHLQHGIYNSTRL